MPNFNIKDFISTFKAIKVDEGFYYNSGTNSEWETVAGLIELIKEHVDSNFE
jgi:UDP-N-acetylglucosamine 4,6-dehydratase